MTASQISFYKNKLFFAFTLNQSNDTKNNFRSTWFVTDFFFSADRDPKHCFYWACWFGGLQWSKCIVQKLTVVISTLGLNMENLCNVHEFTISSNWWNQQFFKNIFITLLKTPSQKKIKKTFMFSLFWGRTLFSYSNPLCNPKASISTIHEYTCLTNTIMYCCVEYM